MVIRSDLVLRSRKGPLTVQRYDVAKVDFEYVRTPQALFTVLANPRPLNDKETQFLSEGQRADSLRVINTSTRLRTADDKLGAVGDEILGHLGFDWRVVGDKPWGQGDRHNWYMIEKFRVTP